MKNDTGPTEYPWYDDRVEAVHKERHTAQKNKGDQSETYNTPRKLYDYLDRHIWKQEEAKKAVSLIMYHCLHGIKTNAMFIGPTGCGKTYIWNCLKRIFPNRIEIVDSSHITMDGWKGTTKWRDLFSSRTFFSGEPCVLVMDEADKMLSPKYSYSENVSHGTQSEGLKLLEGTYIDIKDGPVVHEIDTSKISFVLCGAFSNKAHDVAEKNAGGRIGFGASPKTAVQPYAKPLGAQDLIDFGVMPEFMGRIQRIVNLEPMTVEDYYKMTDSSLGFLAHIQKQYQANIQLTPQKRRELAELVSRTGLGIRGMENQIRQLIDNALFEDCERHCFEF